MSLTAKKVYAILKRQISDMEAKLNSPVRYKGTVATADLLPLNPDIGDMYNIESKSIYGEAGMNVAWNGVVWDTMGAPIDMSLYFTKEEAEAVIQRLVTEYLEKNPVKPGATTEQAQQIEQNKTDIDSLKTETDSLKEDFTNNKTFKLITSSDIVKQTKSYVSKNGELVEVPFTKDLGNFINGNIEYSTDFSIIKLNLSAVRANRKEYDLLPFDNTRKIIDFGEIVPGFKPAKKINLRGFALNFSYISSADGSSIPVFGGDVELYYNTEGHLVLQYFTWSKATEEKPYLNTSFNIWDTIYTNVI